VNGKGSLSFEFLSPLSIQQISPTVGLVSTAFMVTVQADGLMQSAMCKVNGVETVCLLESCSCHCLISVEALGTSDLYFALHDRQFVFVGHLEIFNHVRVLSLHPQRLVPAGGSIQVHVDLRLFGSIFCLFGNMASPSIHVSEKSFVCIVPANVFGNVSLSFKLFDIRLSQEFAISIIDDVRIVSFSPRLHLSGSKFELRIQLSRQCDSCTATCASSCVLDDFSVSGDVLTFNVIGSTGNLTLSLFESLRMVDKATIQLVAWPTVNLSDTLVHVFVGIEGFVPFQGHIIGMPVTCNFGDMIVDPIVSSAKFMCPFNFSTVGRRSLTLSICNQSQSTSYAIFVVHPQPRQIFGSVFNSVFVIGGLETVPNLS
jgi:hypothetical protein